jgi:hypothetical protein
MVEKVGEAGFKKINNDTLSLGTALHAKLHQHLLEKSMMRF